MTELESLKNVFPKLDDLAEFLNKVLEISKDEKLIITADFGIQTLMHLQLVFYAREVELAKSLAKKTNKDQPLNPKEAKEPTKE